MPPQVSKLEYVREVGYSHPLINCFGIFGSFFNGYGMNIRMETSRNYTSHQNGNSA